METVSKSRHLKTKVLQRWIMTVTVGLFTAVVQGWAGEPSEAPLTIQPDNTVIVQFGDPYAATYLQQYLLKCVAKDPDADKFALNAKPDPDRSASKAFPIINVKPEALPKDRNVILLAPLDSIPKAFLTDDERAQLKKAKRNSIFLKRVGNVIVLTKRDADMWNLSHMRVFLDKCVGIRMYAPNGADGLEWVSMPKDNKIAVDKLSIFMQPYFTKGTFSSGAIQRNMDWLRMNGPLTEGLDLRASHSIAKYFPPEKYYEKFPQLYPMGKDGNRTNPMGEYWNPCLADPELAANTVMEQVREKMKAKPAPGYLTISVMDCPYSCQCPVCSASMKAMGGQASNLWYAFLNRVAKQCQQEFPGLYITTYVYSNIRKPPTGMNIEPNIVVDNVIKSYNFTDKKYWDGLMATIIDFSSLGAKWVTHDWNFSGVTPRIYSRQLASMLQWGAQNGMLGMYTEWSGNEYWYIDGANYWVLTQLLSDPYQDTDALWRQYCMDMFGSGWEPMYRFYDMFAQKHVVSDAFYVRGDWARQESCGFSAEDVAQQRKWLEEAMAATKDEPMIQKRLSAIQRYFRAHELIVQAVSVPGRMYQQHVILGKRTDIDKAALAFYVNDDASKLFAFDTYYDTQRTIPPDTCQDHDNSAGIRFSYRNNYSRALGALIQTVRRQALSGVDINTLTEDGVRSVVSNSRRIYKENLPVKRDAKRAAEIEELMTKILWVPKVAEMPKIDGDLSDAAWKKAAKLEGFSLADILVPSRDGNETEGRVMRVGNQLVFGIVCKQPSGIWAETPPEKFTGTSIWRESGCEFFFGSPTAGTEKPDFAQYIVNSLGAFRGFQKAQDNRKDVQCAVKMGEDGKSYTIEAAFPLKLEGQYDYSGQRLLEFNIQRSPFQSKTFNPKERIGWAPIFFTATLPESRGLLILE
jgi:hypothetical protein